MAYTYITHTPVLATLCLVGACAARSLSGKTFSVLCFMALMTFFRAPHVDPAHLNRPELLLSPAQGEILYAGTTADGRWLHIAVYLRLTDVHVQIAPCDSVVTSQSHKDGEFHPAGLLEKSALNERLESLLQPTGDAAKFWGPVRVIQFAGLLARRIVTFVDVGQSMRQGQPIGLIKFSSRVDLLVPYESQHKVLVAKGDRVDVGQPIISSKA